MQKCIYVVFQKEKSRSVKKDKSRSILISGNELISNERIACMSKMRKRYYKYDLVE